VANLALWIYRGLPRRMKVMPAWLGTPFKMARQRHSTYR
jgi:hypothetical protein